MRLSRIHLLAGIIAASGAVQAQTTTVFDLGSGVCVNATNCTIYANNETQWLWWDYNSAGSGFVIFELASWDPSYHAVNQYICGDPNLTPGGSSGVSTFDGTSGTCSNVDSNGVPFSMSYSFQVTPYTTTGGGGKGGGGAGTRYSITGLTVSIDQPANADVPLPRWADALLATVLCIAGAGVTCRSAAPERNRRAH